MFLERLLQITVVTMASLGTLLLSMGPQDSLLPLAVMMAAIASILLTDVTGFFRLNRMAANIAALAAMTWSLKELLYVGSGYEVLELAKLLVYLQVILFFQEKEQRSYWQLMMLSLLQVVVAAAYNQGVWFGVLLGVYMVIGLFGLSIYFFYLHANRYRSVRRRPPVVSEDTRWSLIGQDPEFTNTTSGSINALINREWFRRMGMISVGTLVVALLIFFTVPRFGSSAWRGASLAQRHSVGFDDKVTLGELGRILENPQIVMQVSLNELDWGSEERRWIVGDAIGQLSELYLRGALLTEYDESAWSPAQKEAGPAGPLPTISQLNTRPHPRNPPVAQCISIEPSDREELFAAWPFFPMEANDNLWYDRERRRLVRPPELCSTRYDYQLATCGFEGRTQTPLVPCYDYDYKESDAWRDRLLQMPELEHVTRIANEWVEESELDPDDHYAIARMLERKFHDPDLFQYSLKGQPRDLEMDNIEDFLVNNPKGHCEYFATSLTLMLRSRGIPSRLVVGYRCDEFNELGEYYRVRQLHAHSWVEAYIAPERIPEEVYGGLKPKPPSKAEVPAAVIDWLRDQEVLDELLDQETIEKVLAEMSDSSTDVERMPWRWRSGGWLRLEPTPAGDELMEAEASWMRKIGETFRRFQTVWSDYIMEMDRRRQRKAVYEPAVRAVRQALQHMGDPEWWRGLPNRAIYSINAPAWFTLGGWWRWLLLALGITGAVWLAIRIVRGLIRLAMWLWAKLPGKVAARARRRRTEVAFYRRLEAALARRGLVRAPGQTQREFAHHAGNELSETVENPEIASLPSGIAEAFYHVRFGEHHLDDSQKESIDKSLTVLEEICAG